MRRTLALGAATVLLAAAAVTLAAASSAGGNDRGGKHVQVLQVTRVPGQDVPLDLDHSGGDSIGDEVVFHGDFYVGSSKVGTDGGVCKLVRLPSIYYCDATNSFARGDLTVQTLADFSRTAPGHFAITGGTGAYRGASGEVTYVEDRQTGRAEVTFRFTTR
jgi:allene oxide cyclase-like protein